MQKNEFDQETMYKLFRTVKEILHPTISKKNISDYKIIMDEDVLPVRVYYPKKITNIDKVIIYIHGNGEVTKCLGEYTNICKNFATKSNTLIIAIEYKELKGKYKTIIEEITNTIKYLYDKLIMNNIKEENITVMADSTGCHILRQINNTNKDIPIKKELLFYPVLNTSYTKDKLVNEDFNIGLIESINKYFKDTISKDDILLEDKDNSIDTLVIVGNVDSLKDEIKEYYKEKKNTKYQEIPFSSHGFLNDMDKELSNEVFAVVNKFI